MQRSTQDQFNELSFYTLAHPDMIYFIHQHVVDAYQAQMANEKTKPIGLTFSLIGLYLYLEKDYTGRQVQQAHMKLAQNKKVWPAFELPISRGEITVSQVLHTAPGAERDSMIKEWCKSVWYSYKNSHETVASLVRRELSF
jgi:hypothetical protein